MTPPRPAAGITPVAGCLATLSLALGLLAGCQIAPRALPDIDPAPAVARGPAPSYPDAAAAFNRVAARVPRLFGTGEAAITYTGEDGLRRRDVVDCRLQAVPPAGLALSLSKVGQLGVWLGCDATHYWLIDLRGDTPWAAVGAHSRYSPARAAEIGLPVPPRELLVLLGMVPFDPETPGGTQWSTNGRLLGITSRPGAGEPTRRVWCDPDTLLPVQVELFEPGASARPAALLVSRLSEPVPVVTPGMSIGPSRPRRVIVADQARDGPAFEIELTLENLDQTRVSDRALDRAALLRELRVTRVRDLDAPMPPPGAAVGPPAGAPR